MDPLNLPEPVFSKTKVCKKCGIEKSANRFNGTWCRSCTSLHRKYGMTIEDVRARMEEQNYRCKICEREVRLVVDHNHKTGRIRGLLCVRCNSFLGSIGEDITALERAILYLKNDGIFT